MMHIDAITKAGLVTRSLDDVDRDGKPAKRITAARSYPTSVEDLWDAVTNQERLPRWFSKVSGELRLGGRFSIEGNADGEVLACDPPRSFEITWEFGGGISWVVVELRGEPGGDEAHLELHHIARVPAEGEDPEGEAFWDQFGPGAVGVGWDLSLVGLDLHVGEGFDKDPADVAAWELSDNARDFVTRCSEGWPDAAIADGEDPDTARRRAAAVTHFYTTAPEHPGG